MNKTILVIGEEHDVQESLLSLSAELEKKMPIIIGNTTSVHNTFHHPTLLQNAHLLHPKTFYQLKTISKRLQQLISDTYAQAIIIPSFLSLITPIKSINIIRGIDHILEALTTTASQEELLLIIGTTTHNTYLIKRLREHADIVLDLPVLQEEIKTKDV